MNVCEIAGIFMWSSKFSVTLRENDSHSALDQISLSEWCLWFGSECSEWKASLLSLSEAVELRLCDQRRMKIQHPHPAR